MTVVNSKHSKILLPRSGPDLFWQLLAEHYALEDEMRWRDLAILSLREIAGWTHERIGLAFGLNRGTVCRCLQKIKRELRQQFGWENDVLGEEEFDSTEDTRESPAA